MKLTSYCVEEAGVKHHLMETLVIDKSGRSINGNDGWQLAQMVKQQGKLSTLSNSKLLSSFCHHQALHVSCQSRAVSKVKITKLYWVLKSTLRFLLISQNLT
jgi:hypothetical protein